MPFTGAHPMAVLPFLRWKGPLRLDSTSLVIGSMAPDFEYFAHGEQAGSFSHTLAGVALFCIPATFVLGWLWVGLVRGPLLTIAPVWLRRRLESRPWQPRWTVWVVVSCIVSAGIGALTHLGWDGFTHAQGFITRQVPALHTPVDVPGLGVLALHRVLQYASSIVGLVVLAIVVVRLLRHRPAIELPEVARLWPRLIFVACIAAGATLLTLRVLAHHLRDPGDVAVGAISGILAGVLVASVVVRLAFSRAVAVAG
jgi:hypothetical protein